MAANLVALHAETLSAAWPFVGHWVDAMAKGSGGRLDTLDIVNAIQRHEMQLWGAQESEKFIGAMLSEVLNHPRKREAHLLAATGHNADQWIELMSQVETWASREGCAVLKATCRPGWKKLLKPIGFEETHAIVEKRL